MGQPEYREGAWWFTQPDGALLRWDEPAQRWLPAPRSPETPAPRAAKTERFVSARASALATRVLLYVMAGVCVLAAFGDAFEYVVLDRIATGEHVSDSAVSLSDAIQLVLALALLGLSLALWVMFIVWLYRVYRNVLGLGARGLRYGPGWAIGGWFVPILNLWRPKQIVNDAYRASDPDLPPDAGGAWRDGPIPRALFAWWWGLWLVSSSLAAGVGFNADGTARELRDAAAFEFASDVLTAPAALLCAAVVARVTARQEERAERLAFTGAA